MHNFDIDRFVPQYRPDPVPPKRKRKGSWHPPYNAHWPRPGGWRSQERGLGVRPDKIVNWRDLERRYAHLRAAASSKWTEFWEELKEIGGQVDRTRTKLVMIGDDTLIEISGTARGFSTERASSTCRA